MTRPIPHFAVEFLQQHEKLMLRVYDDANPRVILRPGAEIQGTLTGGYGHTGADVKIGLVVTEEIADGWLRMDMDTAAQRLRLRIGDVTDDLTDHQYAALISFCFNLGADPSWTIWKRLKARQFDQVPLEMMRFVKANGVKLQGLVNRRAAEVALFTTAEPGIDAQTPPSSVLRAMDTQPVATDPVPARKSATLWTIITTAVTGAFAYVTQHVQAAVQFVVGLVTPDNVNQALAGVQPYVEKSNIAAQFAQGLAALGTVLVVFLVLKKRRETRS